MFMLNKANINKHDFDIINYNSNKLNKLPILDDGYCGKSFNHKGKVIGFIDHYDELSDKYFVEFTDEFIENNSNINLSNLSISLYMTYKKDDKFRLFKRKKEFDRYRIDLNDKRISLDFATISYDISNSKTITLCGSSKFKEIFNEVYDKLSDEGHIVFSLSKFLTEEEKENLSYDEKIRLKLIHRRKILSSDKIIVINPDNYIGESTKDEIEYAKNQGKIIEYLFPQTSFATISPYSDISSLDYRGILNDSIENCEEKLASLNDKVDNIINTMNKNDNTDSNGG